MRRHAPQCARQCATLAGRLGAGERLILFAEGTSSDGSRVLPFKSALFGALASPAAGAQVTVEPVTIAYKLLAAHAEQQVASGLDGMRAAA